MSKDARSEDLDLAPAVREQFDRLVALLAEEGFGKEGPPRQTTFAAMERFGHRAGRMVARAIDAFLAQQHAAHFTGEEPCPTCGEKHLPKEQPRHVPLQTDDGEVSLCEPAFRCPPCERDFFPGAYPIGS